MKNTQESAETTAPKARKRRFGDRKDGYKLRTLNPMSTVSPYIMKNRIGSSNYVADSFDCSAMDDYLFRKRREGLKGISPLHVFLAAYIRTVSQRPAINRFIGGQKIYARNNIEMVMTIKKELSLEAPDTVIKERFEPTDTIKEVFEKFNAIIEKNKGEDLDSSFDNTAKVLTYIPGLFLKFTVRVLDILDYFGKLPKSLTDVSPFHGSLVLTSMGSLGIPPIFHHLYDFGNIPVFLAYGAKHNENVINASGEVEQHKMMDYVFNCDERICDGHYYASALRLFKSILKSPDQLDFPPETVIYDID